MYFQLNILVMALTKWSFVEYDEIWAQWLPMIVATERNGNKRIVFLESLETYSITIQT